jgi:4-amino-4-deoxy-L-arabinose transferase-like glycosyltransferase
MNSSGRRKQRRQLRRAHGVRPGSKAAPLSATLNNPAVAVVPSVETPAAPASGLEGPRRFYGLLKHLPYCGVILLFPFFVLAAQVDAIFTTPSTIDPWIYLGFFLNFAQFQGTLFPNTYYGSRLSWIVPGIIVHHIFAPITAVFVLHLLVYLTALFSFYYIAATLIGRRAALLSSVIFGFYPFFWKAVGWDYVDGVGIAYYLLTAALLTRAASRGRHRLALAGAGASFAALLYSNLAWALFTPVLLMHYFGLKWPAEKRAWRRLVLEGPAWAAAGALGLTAILALINRSAGGALLFYSPSVMFALQNFGQPNRWYQAPFREGLPFPWLWFPIFMLTIGIAACSLWLIRPDGARHRRIAVLFTVELLLAAAMFSYLQARGSPFLGIYYYASELIPLVFLAAAPLFWQAADQLRAGWFAVAVASFIVVAAVGWWTPSTSRLHWSESDLHWSEPEDLCLITGAAAALVSSILLQKRRFAIAFSIAGFGLLNTVVSSGRPADTSASQRANQRITDARNAVEQIRGNRPMRWWYDEKDINAGEFMSLTSTYLWGYTLIGMQFPDLPKTPVFSSPCLLGVISSRPDTAEAALTSLAKPLSAQGLSASVKRTVLLHDRGVHYTLALVEINKAIARREGSP